MEHMLLKMARQLDALDEASLMGLWEKYMRIVSCFEPSQRWQEAVLVLSLIQAKHWKNQLFNVQWADRLRGGRRNARPFHWIRRTETPGRARKSGRRF